MLSSIRSQASDNAARPVRAEPKYGAIICVPCGNGYPLNAIHLHLRRTPHHVRKPRRVEWLMGLEPPTFAVDWTDLKTPDDGIIPIQGVKVRAGYACKHCTFRTCSQKNIRRHIAATHPSVNAFERVHLQCWNSTNADRYWIVRSSSDELTGSGINSQETIAPDAIGNGMIPIALDITGVDPFRWSNITR